MYQSIWKIYKRPPIKEYQEYIIERRDLLVPQDIREQVRFTPRQWVELSQIPCRCFGENWQNEYYIWDCAAGTGNLLAGLSNKYNIYASTLDQADVNVMHERIDHGANLLKSHCFQFDFLNDEFFPSFKNSHLLEKSTLRNSPPLEEAGGGSPHKEQPPHLSGTPPLEGNESQTHCQNFLKV